MATFPLIRQLEYHFDSVGCDLLEATGRFRPILPKSDFEDEPLKGAMSRWLFEVEQRAEQGRHQHLLLLAYDFQMLKASNRWM